MSMAHNALQMSKEKRKLTQADRDAFRRVGRIGGLASFDAIGVKGMSEKGKAGAKKRWHTQVNGRTKNKPKTMDEEKKEVEVEETKEEVVEEVKEEGEKSE